jgi:hypothetical protein
MGIRQFDPITPADAERASTNRAGAPEPQVTRSTGQGLLTGAIPAPGRTAEPSTQARALALASGGRLTRAGAALLQLQRQHGNRHVQRVVDRASRTAAAVPVIQTKLMLGTVGDRYEREADRVAEEVVRARSRGTAGQNLFSPRLVVQRLASAQGGAVHPEVQKGIQQARAGGQTISEHVRTSMERALGADFRGVRLHTDDTADWLNRALGARAFTTGKDIFLRRGEYRSDSHSTRRLLAHELTHVLQQDPAVARSEASVIQCKFPVAPYAGDLGDINRIDGAPQDRPHKHQGITSQPSNYRRPHYRLEVSPGKPGYGVKPHYVAQVEKFGGDAYIGDSEATYLGAGAYDTRFLWAIDPLYAQGNASTRMVVPPMDLGNPPAFERVIENVSASVARGSKAAEQEHLNDHRCAYDLTLGAAERAIEAVAGTSFRGASSKQAKTAAETELLQWLKRLSNGNLNSLHPGDWSARYAQLFRRSGEVRDGGDYHLQTFVENTYWNTGLANKLSEKRWGFPVHHVDVAPGQLRLGVPSRDIIDPNPH